MILSGGVSDPSSTGMLAGRLSQSVAAQARQRNMGITTHVIELHPLANEIAVFAAAEDWGDPSFSQRIDRAALELVALVQSGVPDRIRGESWGAYQHELGFNGGEELEIDLDTSMMRLATGGSAIASPAPEA